MEGRSQAATHRSRAGLTDRRVRASNTTRSRASATITSPPVPNPKSDASDEPSANPNSLAVEIVRARHAQFWVSPLMQNTQNMDMILSWHVKDNVGEATWFRPPDIPINRRGQHRFLSDPGDYPIDLNQELVTQTGSPPLVPSKSRDQIGLGLRLNDHGRGHRFVMIRS